MPEAAQVARHTQCRLGCKGRLPLGSCVMQLEHSTAQRSAAQRSAAQHSTAQPEDLAPRGSSLGWGEAAQEGRQAPVGRLALPLAAAASSP